MIKDWAKNQGYAALDFSDSLLDCDGSLVFLLSCLKMRDRDILFTFLNASPLHQNVNSSLTYTYKKCTL